MGKQLGLFSCALVLLTSGIGTGVLVLPYAMKSVGSLVMILLLVGGSFVSFATTFVLFIAATAAYVPRNDIELSLTKGDADTSGHGETLEPRTETYSGLVVKNSAPWVGVLLDSVFIFHGLGTAVGYFIFLSDFLTTFPFWPIKSQRTTIYILAVAEFPCVLGRTAAILSKLGSFSVTAMVMLIVGIMFRAPGLAEARTEPTDAVREGWLGRLPGTLCIAVFAFQWQNTSVHAANLLRNPTPRRCALCAGGATALLFCIYIAVAGSAYASFGRATEGNIVLMYPEEDPIFIVIRGCLIFSVAACMAANMFPARDAIINRLGVENGILTRVLVVGSALALTSSLAIVAPSVTEVVAILGGTGCTAMMCVFPCLVLKQVVSRTAWIWIVALATPFMVFLELSGLQLIGTSE
jgi:amino acid permease